MATVNPSAPTPGRCLELTIEKTPVTLELADGIPLPAAVEFLEGYEAVDVRRAGLVPVGGLASERVLLAGAGSMGSKIAAGLSEAGVERIEALDCERLDTANLARHTGNILDLGRKKPDVVAEQASLRLSVGRPLPLDITELASDQLDGLVRGASLVVGTMDSPAAMFLLNEALIRTGTPGLFAQAYERACGGEILVVPGGRGPCLFCATGFRVGLEAGLLPQERRQAYQAADTNRLVAEPGLGTDITFLASVATAYALAVLDPTGSRADLLLDGGAFVLVHGGSRPRDTYAELFRRPFEILHARVTRSEPCPVCGHVTQLEKAS